MALLNYTSGVDADKTAQEIAKCLSSHGASAVLTDYEDGILSAISFQIMLGDRKMGFKLPCDWRPVLEVLKKDRKAYSSYDSRYEKQQSEWRLQAVRTAWRIVKDWVEAQMALVETQMATTQTVFLSYAVMQDGRTLSEHVAEKPALYLGDEKRYE